MRPVEEEIAALKRIAEFHGGKTVPTPGLLQFYTFNPCVSKDEIAYIRGDYLIVFSKVALARHIIFSCEQSYSGLIAPGEVALDSSDFIYHNSDFRTKHTCGKIILEKIDHEDIPYDPDPLTAALIRTIGT